MFVDETVILRLTTVTIMKNEECSVPSVGQTNQERLLPGHEYGGLRGL